MSLYPSLEDMKFDQLAKAQDQLISTTTNPPNQTQQPPPYPITYSSSMPQPQQPINNSRQNPMYPALGDYMGLELSEAMILENMPEYMAVATTRITTEIVPANTNNLIAPLSGQTDGLRKAQISHGIRELILCKDKDNKIGLRVKAINNGIFVCLVIEQSPAALVGLRFGDQILQINGKDVAGYTMDKVHDVLRKCPVNGINIIVRDRPFERTITLHKDSTRNVGFQFKNGKIVSIVKDSSASRNGVLTEHQLLEINGQNVVGMKDKNISKIIENSDDCITITVIPSFMYDHMVKKMAGSLIKDFMDHSIPNLI